MENLKNEKSIKHCVEFSNDKEALENLFKKIEIKRELIEMNENLTTNKIYIKNLETQKEIDFLFIQKIFSYTLENETQRALDNFLCLVLMYVKIISSDWSSNWSSHDRELFNTFFSQENIDCLPC